MKALNTMRFPPGSAARAILAAEAVLVIGLAVQTARLVWTLASPLAAVAAPTARSAPAIDLTILARFDAFGADALGAAGAAAGGSGVEGLRLHAVRVGGVGGGSAIIGTPDGVQRVYRVGEAIQGGATLAGVAEDHVEIARNGARAPLSFPIAQ